ncbi:hypothetical protein F2Q69_00036141 [Brassica cretica]|uniref:Uncharacterized protein n=1 Tax=Brassica cretica TaxID=69181 RepID=A0A8S9SU73_BRACR|nr:hypothetical protein F2Q69_00036141 [Brassica cretica]
MCVLSLWRTDEIWVRSDLASAGEDGGETVVSRPIAQGTSVLVQSITAMVFGSSDLVARLFTFGHCLSGYFGVPEPLPAASVEAVGSHFRVRVRATGMNYTLDMLVALRIEKCLVWEVM